VKEQFAPAAPGVAPSMKVSRVVSHLNLSHERRRDRPLVRVPYITIGVVATLMGLLAGMCGDSVLWGTLFAVGIAGMIILEVKATPLVGPGLAATIIGRGFVYLIALGGAIFFGHLGYFYGVCFAVLFTWSVISPHSPFHESPGVDRRQPRKHRWLSNRLKPRKMHFGPRRLF
jgi:hypothetical protein